MTTDNAAIVKLTPNDKNNTPGKLADAEIHFTGGILDGLKLIGFGVWERRSGNGRNVTFPARQYSVNGERRSFALLRPIADATAQDRIRDLILTAYANYEEQAAAPPPTCPTCSATLTDRTTDNAGRPTYCDTCDREPEPATSTAPTSTGSLFA